MKKIFYCFLLLTFFVLSCSKEEADMDGSQNKETENKEIKIILEAETSSQNIFAPIVFYQSFDFGKDAPCLSEVYDSIVWKSSHSPNSFKVFSHSNYARYVETTFFKWAHVYYSPGTYKTYLLGYKNNEIINCTPQKRFQGTRERIQNLCRTRRFDLTCKTQLFN